MALRDRFPGGAIRACSSPGQDLVIAIFLAGSCLGSGTRISRIPAW